MNPAQLLLRDAQAIAAAVRAGNCSVQDLVVASLERIAATEPRVNAFTEVTAARAQRRAAQLDRDRGALRDLPLAGVPFAVKNLFDIEGLRTRAARPGAGGWAHASGVNWTAGSSCGCSSTASSCAAKPAARAK